jgi:hypothetical protein
MDSTASLSFEKLVMSWWATFSSFEPDNKKRCHSSEVKHGVTEFRSPEWVLLEVADRFRDDGNPIWAIIQTSQREIFSSALARPLRFENMRNNWNHPPRCLFSSFLLSSPNSSRDCSFHSPWPFQWEECLSSAEMVMWLNNSQNITEWSSLVVKGNGHCMGSALLGWTSNFKEWEIAPSNSIWYFDSFPTAPKARIDPADPHDTTITFFVLRKKSWDPCQTGEK